jgi:histone H3/H4
MGDNFVVASKIKEFISGKGYNCAGDLSENLSIKVQDMLKEAIDRAEANGRKTVMSKDL